MTIQDWRRGWGWQRVMVILAIAVGAFLRLYHFPQTLQFLGDQGRDALIVKRIIIDHRPVLIGPVTSTGNMYLGPLYYYMMAPFMAVTYPSPVGPAYAVAVLSIITIWLMYRLGRELVGAAAAAAASVFFACSATVILFARFSWNPNPAPFFSLILIWATYRALSKSVWYWVLVSAMAAVLIQLHYITLLTIPAAGLLWLWDVRRAFKADSKKLILATLAAIGIFLISLTPLVIFDIRHQWLNLNSLQTFLFQKEGTVAHISSGQKMIKTIKETQGRSLQVLAEMFIGKARDFNNTFVVGLGAVMIWLVKKKNAEKSKHYLGYLILATFTVVAIIGLAFYQSTVFYHYVAYLFPISLLVYGVVAAWLWQFTPGKLGVAAFFVGFMIWNFQHLPLRPLDWDINRMHSTADTIATRVKSGEKYNIVLLTGTGDIEGQNYRYFLETTPNKPLPKERWGETDTLFIINEDKKISRVVDSPIYEIVVFPNKTPSEVYTIPDGPEITVLRR